MGLAPGTRLGPYEVVQRIASGGMGEVYRARDPRLNRSVAIKVLLGELTSRPGFAVRFEREAQAMSSFSHPNICTVYDFGTHDGQHFLVMEHLEGETLADRLHRGPLPVKEFMACALQIADALAEAHRRGHIHRDLKPDNVMLTRTGAKLVDFGLTKVVGSSDLPVPSDLTRSITTGGTIVGTVPYMSPEQLQGRDADERSDIFSFGAVLYEMATGRQAFKGDSAASVIAAILERQPAPIVEVQTGFPETLDWIIRTCLEKDPEHRWHAVHDLKLELTRARDKRHSAPPAAVGGRRWLLPVAAIAGAVVALAVAYPLLTRRSDAPPAPIAFEIPSPAGAYLSSFTATVSVIHMSVSPDGGSIAFTALNPHEPVLWLRSLAQPAARALPGTEGAQEPFWSPDSRSIAFFAQNALKKIDLASGAVTSLAEVSIDPRGGAWLPSGIIVYAPSNRGGLLSIRMPGGKPEPVFTGDSVMQRWWPSPLPDGKRFLYQDRRAGGVFVGSLDGQSSRRVLESDSAAVYVDPGYLLYLQNGSLMAQRMDARSTTISGEPTLIAQNIGAATNGMPGFSATAEVLAHSPILVDTTTLSWCDRRGVVVNGFGEPASYLDPRLSRDGRWIAWSRLDPLRSAPDIWMHDTHRGTTTRFTTDRLLEASPLWSPDGSRILYRSNRTGLVNLYIRERGGGPDQAVFQDNQLQAHGGAHNIVPGYWSGEQQYIVYTAPGQRGFDIFAMSLEPGAMPKSVAVSAFNEMHPEVSPDGRWIAFASDASGRLEVNVQTYPEGRFAQQISVRGGYEPHWRADGRELYFLTADGKLAAAPVSATGDIGNAQELFAVRTPVPTPYRRNYHPAADGSHFIINAISETHKPPALSLLINWTNALKR